jgi:phosphoribosyl 1,2-cyclic phosphodiesterase
MSIELCILASGSAGNSTVLRTPSGAMLIDAGVGPRTVEKRLGGAGFSSTAISAICLTHLDRDHFTPTWLRTIVKRGIRLYCHHQHRDELGRIFPDPRLADHVHCFDGLPFEPLPALRIQSIAFAHDRTGSHGFVIEGFGCRVGYATDLGRVPDELIERFQGVNVLALESNYDPQMQLASSRPWFLKQRIMGGLGHLSNQQAYDAICRILDRCETTGRPLPGHIVLLHRSRECNCPDLVRNFFSRDPRIAPRLVLTEQTQRTGWLPARSNRTIPGEQLTLGFA